MNPENQNQFITSNSPVPPPSFQSSTPETNTGGRKKTGLILVSLLILIIIIAVFFSLSSLLNKKEIVPQQNTQARITNTPAQIPEENIIPTTTVKDITPITNTADDLDSLQNDLNASIDGLDTQAI